MFFPVFLSLFLEKDLFVEPVVGNHYLFSPKMHYTLFFHTKKLWVDHGGVTIYIYLCKKISQSNIQPKINY